jgi:iron complex transport system permease protein
VTLRLAALLLFAACAMVAGLLIGGTPVGLGEIAHALSHPHGDGIADRIVWDLRLPRVCIAAVVGASLAVCGALLQGMLRNPLVDPYLTGVSAASAAAIAIALLVGASTAALPVLGFGAALGAAVLVAALARRGSGIDSNRLILAGVSLSTLFAAITTLAIVRARSNDFAGAVVAWLAGSMAGRDWHDLAIVSPYIVAGLALSAWSVPVLNALRAGDTRARSAGVDLDRAQWVILAATSLLAASSVVLAGLVGFVGLIVPHIARRVTGTDARVMLPACALLGAAFCTFADAICRWIVAPAELPIGVLLAFVGVPSFLYLYLRRTAVR